jgi:hypothetical protein
MGGTHAQAARVCYSPAVLRSPTERYSPDLDNPSAQAPSMPHVLLRLSACLLPLALTPAWAYLIAESHLDFGGGEKDLLLLIPWLAWSLVYLAFSVVLWIRRRPIRKGILYSAGGATIVLILAWLVIFVWVTVVQGTP